MATKRYRATQVKQEEFSNPPPVTNEHGMSRTLRDIAPAHYVFKIESYSSLSKTEMETIESGVFEAGGYKWRLYFYPNGNNERNGKGHVSLYLATVEMETLPHAWEVNVQFKLFVYDQIRDKYLTIQDANGAVCRFHEMKTEWGFAQLLPLHVFNDAFNGYLVDDCCAFGAEILVIKCMGNMDCLSMVKETVHYTYTWKIEKFSTLQREVYDSEIFTAGGRKWKLRVYPKGFSYEKGKSLSGFLELVDHKMRKRHFLDCN